MKALRKRVVLQTLLFTLLINTGFAQTAESTSTEHFWLWSLLGRLHTMVVHFPIGLLFVALLMEIIGRKSGRYKSAIRLLIYTGAASAVVAVVFGLLLSKTEEYGSDALSYHQWTGIATMVFALLTALSYKVSTKLAQRILLTLTVVGITVAGHYGASLTHGEDYLTSELPTHKAEEKGEDQKSNFILPAAQKGPLSETQVQELNLQVRTILAHNCYNCHGSGKVKGELRLDTKELMIK